MKTFFSARNSLRNSIRNSFKSKISKTTTIESKKTIDLMISQENISSLQYGKFKATRKLAIILNLFKSGIEKKTYKVRFRKYENVFSGKEALDFLSNNVLPTIQPTETNLKVEAKKLIVFFLKQEFLICLNSNFNVNNSYTFSDTDIYCINEDYTIPEIPLENQNDYKITSQKLE